VKDEGKELCKRGDTSGSSSSPPEEGWPSKDKTSLLSSSTGNAYCSELPIIAALSSTSAVEEVEVPRTPGRLTFPLGRGGMPTTGSRCGGEEEETVEDVIKRGAGAGAGAYDPRQLMRWSSPLLPGEGRGMVRDLSGL